MAKKKGIQKGAFFLTGLAAGVALTYWWRPLAKRGMRLGIQATHKLNELSQKAREELEDVAAEATAETAQPSSTPSGTPAGDVH